MSSNKNIIELQNVSVIFNQKGKQINAVNNVDLDIVKGDIFGIIGYSGAGKSTLVRVINLLQPPTSGKVIVNELELQKLDQKNLRKARKKIGMIFQHFNLMNSRTVIGNVEYPLLNERISKSKRMEKAASLLKMVGLEEYKNSYPRNLSGGQKQRVAIARALAADPETLISDEATSALDPKTTKSILNLLKKVNQKLGITIVLITHEMQVVSSICHNVAVMDNGQIIERGPVAEVFANPKQKLTADFIETATNVKDALDRISSQRNFPENSCLVYLKFIGKSSNKSIISQISRDYELDINILFANIDQIDGTDIGYMISEFVGSQQIIEKVIDQLRANGITAKVIEL